MRITQIHTHSVFRTVPGTQQTLQGRCSMSVTTTGMSSGHHHPPQGKAYLLNSDRTALCWKWKGLNTNSELLPFLDPQLKGLAAALAPQGSPALDQTLYAI